MADLPDPVRLHAASYRRTPWKNGGGVTIDIADRYRPGAEAGGWDGMIWRFGRTRIEAPAPFSDLSGHDRILVAIQGRGLVLRVDDGRILDVREPFRPVRFRGDDVIVSELEDGPVEVLNLMGDRAAVHLDLQMLEVAGTIRSPAGDVVLYAPRRDRLMPGRRPQGRDSGR